MNDKNLLQDYYQKLGPYFVDKTYLEAPWHSIDFMEVSTSYFELFIIILNFV